MSSYCIIQYSYQYDMYFPSIFFFLGFIRGCHLRNGTMAGEQQTKAPKPKNDGSGTKKGEAAPPVKPKEYNPRWKGYTWIALASLITFSSVSLTAVSVKFQGNPGLAVAWGVITFAFSSAVLVLDRTQCLLETFNFTKVWDGKLEGYTLLSLVVFWIVGVSFITQVNGVGYLTMNTYFGTWFTLFSCIYTLNEWSTAKDILSIDELTGVSATLKSWYVLFLSSLVVMGTGINYMAYFTALPQPDAAACVALGCVSSLVSFAWICVHYKFITVVATGGWTELLIAAAVAFMWIVVVAVATKEGGVGSTIVGTSCGAGGVGENSDPGVLTPDSNCTILIIFNNQTTEYSCMDVLESEVPGSNLYVFTWVALLSAFNVCFRWKAQQALQFAQTQRARVVEEVNPLPGDVEDDDADDYGDDDNDLDGFEDAKR